MDESDDHVSGTSVSGPQLELVHDPTDVTTEWTALAALDPPIRAFPEFAPPWELDEPAPLPVEIVELEELGDDADEVRASIGAAEDDEQRVVLIRSTDDPSCWLALRVVQWTESFTPAIGPTRSEDRMAVLSGVIAPTANDLVPVLRYVAGEAPLPRAIAAIWAMLAAVMPSGATIPATLEDVVVGVRSAPTDLPARARRLPDHRGFLSPVGQDRAGTVFNRPTWDVLHEVAARDRSVSVRSMLARLRGELLGDAEEVLAADPDPEVRAGLALEIGHRRAATVVALLTDTDEAVAMAILGSHVRLPEGLDLSAAVDSPFPLVRATVACLRDHLDDDALDRLRRDPDPDVAAAARPERRCATFVSGSDARAHVTMLDPDAPARDRLEAARSIVGARNPAADPTGYGAEILHAACVVDVAEDVIRRSDPEDASLVALAGEVVRAEFSASIQQQGGHNVNEFGTGAVWRAWLTERLLPAGADLGGARDEWNRLGALLADCEVMDR